MVCELIFRPWSSRWRLRLLLLPRRPWRRKRTMYRIMEGCLRQRRLKWCARRERWRSPLGIKVPRRLRLRLRLLLWPAVAAIPPLLDNHHHRGNHRRFEIGPLRITSATLPLTWAVVAVHLRLPSALTRRSGDGPGLALLLHRRPRDRPRTRCPKLARSHELLNCGPP